MMELPVGYPDFPVEMEDSTFPCKGCNEILEEGKAFELAGHRWHIDCFRCNTCGTLLDSDANLLLLGDGSLICNNCTYSCSACGDKIEDLAILTGDQAYCAGCFRCRNCKRKIENLRYARTTQGMFCMECHDGLMARRRKKSARTAQKAKNGNNGGSMLLDKSLPSLPPSRQPQQHTNLSPDHEAASDSYLDAPVELPAVVPRSASGKSRQLNRDRSPATSEDSTPDGIGMSSAYRNRSSDVSQQSGVGESAEEYFIPLAMDPNPVPGPLPLREQKYELDGELPRRRRIEGDSSDFFGPKMNDSSRTASLDAHSIPPPSRRSGDGPRSHSPHLAAMKESLSAELEAPGPSVMQRKVIVPSDESAESTPRNSRGEIENARFQLQDAPKRRKSTTSDRSPKGERTTPTVDTSLAADPKSTSAPSSALAPLREQHVNIGLGGSPRTSSLSAPRTDSPRVSQESKPEEGKPPVAPRSLSTELALLPKRGDSLQRSAPTTSVSAIPPRKDLNGPKSISSALGNDGPRDLSSSRPSSLRASLEPSSSASMNGGKVISRPIESPISKSGLDFPARSQDRMNGSALAEGDSFSSPRAPPQPPTDGSNKQHMHKLHKDKKASISSLPPDVIRSGEPPGSPSLPRYQNTPEFSMADDMNRIMGADEADQSFLRRVSNSVRHARSYSDRGSRNSKEPKWPRTPLNGSHSGPLLEDLSSPTSPSPDARDEMSWVRNELRKERERVSVLQRANAELESALEDKSTIKQMNTELREKRSTMVVLDTQKEIVVRELEVLTDHIAAAKRSREPLDLSNLSNTVMREFAAALQDLKESYTPQIEELTEKKVQLADEVGKLINSRDKTMQEFEQLSAKNAQLAELNNNLVHQIQEIHKAGATPETLPRHASQGLGIYTQHRQDKSSLSVDSRGDMRSSVADSQMTGSTLGQDNESENGTQFHNAPRVINIRKEQPKKTFNWKKGGNVAKGMTKGLKGAFTSTNDNRYQRDVPISGGLTEGIPYGAMSREGEMPTTVLPGKFAQNEVSQPKYGFFGQPKKQTPSRGGANGNVLSEEPQHPAKLFGAELETRAEWERVSIPGIVTRCIQEVELRGMDAEGIYRRSGGNSQIQVIRDGFIQSTDFDISDPDLDITAVTSTLKQYFRKLPTPLITYPVYDLLLASTAHPSAEERILMMRAAISELPPCHRDCLEFLVFHLARVVEREKENLMTSLNCAVVFAPSIMRPESIAREMSDTPAKNLAVQFLIENCHAVFLGANGSM